MILTFSKDSKKFFIDKSYGVLIEVAICSPGNIQLPSLNAYFSQFPKTAYYDVSITTQRAVTWVSVLTEFTSNEFKCKFG